MTERSQVTTLQQGLIEMMLQLVLKARGELFKSFTMHQQREEFLKRLPAQDSQVKKGIGVAQFHKIATAKYADLSYSLIQTLLAMSSIDEIKALRIKAQEIERECNEMKETREELNRGFKNALSCVHDIRNFVESAETQNYTTEQYATEITKALLKHRFLG